MRISSTRGVPLAVMLASALSVATCTLSVAACTAGSHGASAAARAGSRQHIPHAPARNGGEHAARTAARQGGRNGSPTTGQPAGRNGSATTGQPGGTDVRHASRATAQQVSRTGTGPGVVLVNQPASRVCAGHGFTVGVWFQRPGSSRAYRLAVYGPDGQRIFYRSGLAPSSHWAFWRIRASQAGTYHTAYFAHWTSATTWTRYKVATTARRC